ncbi:kinase [Nocardia sp. NPDC057663]|uniref:kinase n=1 Tax=Nocardia sp. NPDC057663 TaxID=3346201 RepID=UPI00366E304B
MTDEAEISRLTETGQMIWINERYGARYAIDRPGLSQLLADGFIPVVHAGQPEVIAAVETAMPEVRWTVVQLVTDLATAKARIVARDTGDIAERLAARDATPQIVANATFDTAQLTPDQAAEYIEAAVRLRAGPATI